MEFNVELAAQYVAALPALDSVESNCEMKDYSALPRGHAHSGRRHEVDPDWRAGSAGLGTGPTLDALNRASPTVPFSYAAIQELVRKFCRWFGGTPLLLDVFARNQKFHIAPLHAIKVAKSERHRKTGPSRLAAGPTTQRTT